MFRYNFGSLAFGSLLLALIWFVIIVFEYLNKKLSGGNNPL
jgi:Plasma-membrane choline transporter